ncbi:HAMP domain-containing histidine kinase [Candidatus Sumerlaeota bacterium]|nr:HAMP domain-containing sensor histidine kinase [Candidatus Sumerlaeales bacterium]NLD61563.1 HAMP domain-containing histidine kinase [Candidatus Sumerlaeota bacterium]
MKIAGTRQLLSFKRLPIRVTIIILLGSLLVFNLSGWYWMRSFEISKETDSQQQLEMVASSVNNAIRTPQIPSILPYVHRFVALENIPEILERNSETTHFKSTQERLLWQRQNFNLQDIALLTTGGLIVADSNNNTIPGDLSPFAALDTEAMDKASHGELASIKFYRVKDQYYRRLYLPIRDGDSVVGIIQLSMQIPYIAELRSIRVQAALQSIIGSLIIIVIGMTIFRLIKRTLKAEETLMQTTRIEAMGSMTAGIAHEIRNPLTAIQALAEEAADQMTPVSQCRQNANDILTETKRLADITDNFLTMAKNPDVLNCDDINIEHVIESIIRLLKKGTAPNININAVFPKNPCIIRANAKALQQIILNLLLNATQALPETGGDVTIIVQNNPQTDITEITIRDTGVGIAPKTLERIFEPFFSTKKNGTGLGLPLTRALLQSMNASCKIKSKEGKGTTVSIEFPTGK